MHFLSHYYVDRSENNPFLVLGSLLPDIAPHFTKTYNAVIRKREWQFEEPQASIHRGVLRHYEVDAVFHASQVFRDCCRRTSLSLAEQGLDRERYRFWFISHIITEAMLDRQLILEYPGLVMEYYEVLSSVDINMLDAYLNFIVAKDEKNKILANFIRYLDVRFLKYFEKVEGVAEGIIRTAQRATSVSFGEEDRNKLIAALHNIESDIRYSSKKLLEV